MTAPGVTSAGVDALLAGARVLPTRPRVPGHDRDCGPGDGCVFGTEWNDDTDAPDGHNDCDTRNDVLGATLDDVVLDAGSYGCDHLFPLTAASRGALRNRERAGDGREEQARSRSRGGS